MMYLLHKQDVIKSAPRRWEEQYKNYGNRYGHIDTMIKLNSLEWPFTDKQVNDIIGNDRWTKLECAECGKDVETLVHIGDEPDYDACWVDICMECVTRAYNELLIR